MNKTVNHTCIQDYLRLSFAENADRLAVIIDNYSFTYEQLNNHTQALADNLRQYKSYDKPFCFVSCLFANRVNYLVALLACLKANCIFVPLNTNAQFDVNIERSNHIGASCFLHDNPNTMHGPNHQLYYDLLFNNLPSSTTERYDDYNSNDLVYLYLSSGTSLQQKAILGKNCGLAQFINWEIEQFHITSCIKVLQLTEPVFDPYLRDVLMPLCVGGTLFFPTYKIHSIPHVLTQFEEDNINLLHITPSYMDLLLRLIKIRKKIYNKFRLILFAGEKLSVKTVNECKEVFPNAVFVNLYGPTETTLAKAYYVIDKSTVYDNWIPIGNPIENAQIYVMDNDRLCDIGEFGELCIDTQYASHGYYQNSALTKQKFIDSPFQPNSTLYRTGDKGYKDQHGLLNYVCRMDRQVKIAGIRIDLSELEELIKNQYTITDCVVCMIEQIGLVMYYTSEFVIDERDMRNYLEKYFQRNVTFKYIVHLDVFPLNISGKKDIKQLSSYSYFLSLGSSK